MKRYGISVVLSALLFTTAASAQNAEKSPLDVSVTTDFAWYTASAYCSGDTHYAPVTGIYDGIQARTTLSALYRIPVSIPLLPEDSMLFKDNNITFTGQFEVTPVSLMPKAAVSFFPAAFLVFSAGGMAGTGWDLAGIQGISGYDVSERTYKSLTPFRSWYLCGYANGTFMFDTAALWPGEWHHIVMVANYEIEYRIMTGTSSTVWDWQTTKGCADGWQYDQYYLIAYQMPGIISLAGISAELYGHYNAADYGDIADSYGGDFMTVEICPLVQLRLSERDSMFAMLNFKARRSFRENHSSEDEEPLLTYTGREWYFQRIALRWKHTF
ncbi:MAG: hypothetical protein M0P01_01695 [Treponema sp.]|nr:hypothetical protein [Treponema sp.]